MSGLNSDANTAEVDTTGFGAGLSFAYFPGGGFYADVQGRFTAWDGDVENTARGIDQDINAMGWGYGLYTRTGSGYSPEYFDPDLCAPVNREYEFGISPRLRSATGSRSATRRSRRAAVRSTRMWTSRTSPMTTVWM